MTSRATGDYTGGMRVTIAFGGLLLLTMAGLLARGGFAPPSAIGPRLTLTVAVLLAEGLWVAAWWGAAWGYGRPLRAALGRPADGVAEMILGGGALALLASISGLWAVGPGWCWTLGAPGWLLATRALVQTERGVGSPRQNAALRWSWLATAPPIGALLVACAVAPPGLWASEGHGYDVLAYHLQLPAAWWRAGAIVPTPDNAYGYLPNLAEASYLLLAGWRGGDVGGAVLACQLLHASWAALAALALSAWATPCGGRRGLCAALYLAAPLTLITGSLAYNEQLVAAFGALALGLAAAGDRELTRRELSLIGLLAGLATLAKPTALLMIGGPLLVLLIWRPGARGRRLLTVAAVGCLTLAPWLLRNAIWTGNPVFPLLSETLGRGHWPLDSAQRWQRAHQPGLALDQLPLALWQRWIADTGYGWLIIPVALTGAGVATRRRHPQAPPLLIGLAAQLIAWACLTHREARFLAPTLLLLVPLAAIGLRGRTGAALTLLAILTASGLGARAYLSEAQAPAMIDGVTHLRTPPPGVPASPWAKLDSLPPAARVFAEGYCTPLYARRQITTHSVWDPSPLGEPLARSGAAARDWLREQGYTHLLIDWDRLASWQRPGGYGYDPRVTLDRLQGLVRPLGRPLQRWGDRRSGLALYRLR